MHKVVDILNAVALIVGLIGLWLCLMYEPKPKNPGTKRDGLGRS